MNDPVAEAAARIAADAAPSSTEPSGIIGEIVDEFHKLEEKVEHLIHPETVPNVTPGSPVIADSATLLDASGQPITSLDSAKPFEQLSTETPAPASTIGSAEPSTSTQTLSAESDLPNVLPASTSGIASESTTSVSSGLKTETVAGIQGVATIESAEPVKLASEAKSAIKAGVANIKHHLSIRGFEQSAVADIHAELAAIEKWL